MYPEAVHAGVLLVAPVRQDLDLDDLKGFAVLLLTGQTDGKRQQHRKFENFRKKKLVFCLEGEKTFTFGSINYSAHLSKTIPNLPVIIRVVVFPDLDL